MLSEQQEAICKASEFDAAGLTATLVNASLKPSAEQSHTDTLLDVVEEIFDRHSVAVSACAFHSSISRQVFTPT